MKIYTPQINDAAIVQQSWWYGPYTDMLRLTWQRHAAYALAQRMDYWPLIACLRPDLYPGGWGKVWLLRQVAERDYKYIFWIDTDAAVVDFESDLRDGIPEGKGIAACEHWAPDWFPQYDIPPHFNIGVTFWRNGPRVRAFLDDWLGRYPGKERWMEQGTFNDMIAEERYKDLFHPLEDKYNATVKVNEVEKPVIQGWHGVMPEARRLAMMRETFKDDFLKFRV